MRIVHLLDSLNAGGVEMLALDLCRNASSSGLEVILVALRSGELEEEFKRSGSELIVLHRKNRIDLKTIFQLRKIATDRKIDVVHCHQAVEGMHAYLATLNTNVRRVLSLHGYIPNRRIKLALKFLLPRMDANIAVSRELLSYVGLRTKYKAAQHKIQIIYNGVDSKRIQGDGRAIRKELDLMEDDILLGMVGNFYNKGGQRTICRSLAKILQKYPNCHFVFVGGFDQNSQNFRECKKICLENHALKHTHFLGRRHDVGSILRGLDVFVYSSNRDTFGIAVIEAMVAGLPVVMGNNLPLLEIDHFEDYVCLFKADDEDDLARKVIELIERPVLGKQLGSRAREWSMKHFEIQNYIHNLESLYERLLFQPRKQ